LGTGIVHAAEREVGKGESGRDNYGPDIDRFKSITGHTTNGGAWCTDFASFVLAEEAPGLIHPTSVAKRLMGQFMEHSAFMDPSHYTPKPGDTIFFDRSTPEAPWKGHVGFVAKVDPDGTVHTIEGNKADPRFKGKVEGIDYKWSKDLPDAVREVTYSPDDLRQERIMGYGSIETMAQNSPAYHPAPAAPAPVVAMAPDNGTRQRS
jgi:hypothetical protein